MLQTNAMFSLPLYGTKIRLLVATIIGIAASFVFAINTYAKAPFDRSFENYDQVKTVTGTVTDKDNQPLAGVTVTLKGTNKRTVTNSEGYFTIANVPEDGTLIFSYVGMNPQEVPVANTLVFNIIMEGSPSTLGEVVAIGYGSVQKKKITGSVSNVTPKDFNKGVTNNAADLLRGRVAGLNVTQPSGDVTAEQTLRIRGTSSLTGSSSPFVVIDGVPGLSLSSVAPQDIASISVLKDASAAAIYGSRSGSGVIVITTKNGREGKPSIDYTTYVAKDYVSNKPDLLTADEWRQYTTSHNIDTTGFDKGGNTDWFGALLRHGTSQNHDLSISGGGNGSRYRASVSYLDRQGVVMKNDLQRINARMAFSQKGLNDKLKISVVGAITQRDYRPAGSFDLAYNMLPVYPIKNPDGSWFDILQPGLGNPVKNLELNSQKHKASLSYINARADLEIVKNLVFGASVLKERETDDFGLYLNSNTTSGRPQQGLAQRSNSTRDKQLLELTATYQKEFGDHSINLLAGYSYEDNRFQNSLAQSRQYATDFFTYNNLAAGENIVSGDVSSGADRYKLIAAFGRLNYDYKGRYILTGTVRRDGSSKFGANHKWGTFPSIAAAWRIIGENFMKNVNVLTELKLRASYGVSGNQDGIDPYRSLQLYGISGQYYDAGNTYAAYKIIQNANPDLKWEETAVANVGLDFATRDNRISGTLEYYDRTTKDLLFTYDVPVPPNLYPTILANVGTMSNKGVELYLSADIIRNQNVTWGVSVNLAHNKNVLKSLSNDLFSTSSIKYNNLSVRGSGNQTTHILEEGKPVGTFFGWRNLGIDTAGKFIMDDMVDGTPGLTNNDWTDIGNAQPDLTYGFSTNVAYKNLDFSVFLRGVHGNSIINVTRMRYASSLWLPGENVLHEGITNGIKDNPRYSSYYIEKGSFLRLDNATIGYNFNLKNSLATFITRLRVFASGQNLFLITKYKGLDPEVNADGLAPGIEQSDYYPKTRTYSVGFSVSF